MSEGSYLGGAPGGRDGLKVVLFRIMPPLYLLGARLATVDPGTRDAKELFMTIAIFLEPKQYNIVVGCELAPRQTAR